MGCHFLLQGIFPTQGSNPGLLHCRQMLLPSKIVLHNLFHSFLQQIFNTYDVPHTALGGVKTTDMTQVLLQLSLQQPVIAFHLAARLRMNLLKLSDKARGPQNSKNLQIYVLSLRLGALKPSSDLPKVILCIRDRTGIRTRISLSPWREEVTAGDRGKASFLKFSSEVTLLPSPKTGKARKNRGSGEWEAASVSPQKAAE